MSRRRSVRTDALRNRERLIDVARKLFLAAGNTVALDTVAKAAEVGIGTLYRHFPTREALLTAVYSAELDMLEREADALLEAQAAADALRMWMDSYARFVATKYAMHGASRPALTPASTSLSETRSRICAAVAKFFASAAVDRSLRCDVQPDDVALTLAAMVMMTAAETDTAQRGRLLDLLMDGLRP